MGNTLLSVLLLFAVGAATAGSLRHDAASSTTRPKCGEHMEYKYYAETNSCYKFHRTKKTWLSAYTTCVKEGGLLAVINSGVEAGIFTELTSLQEYGSDYLSYIRIYLGFSNWEDGYWRTVQGESLNKSGYANWRDGEPNNYGGYQRCGAMYYNSELDDDDCLHKSAFICEMQPNHYEIDSTLEEQYWNIQRVQTPDPSAIPDFLATTVEIPTEVENKDSTSDQEYEETSKKNTSETGNIEILHTGYNAVTTVRTGYDYGVTGWLASTQPNCGTDKEYRYYEQTNVCYKFHHKATWQIANSTCVREGAHLSVLRSQYQVKIFRGLALRDYTPDQRTYIRYFAGFRKMEGSWITVQGESLYETGYVNWRYGEPNNFGGHQDCGAMYAENGELDDDDCDHENPFICEKPIVQQNEDSDGNPTSEDDITTINTTEVETERTTVSSESVEYNITEVPRTDPAVCSLQKQQGPCTNFSKRWFFDVTYGRCRTFLYGGCGGNGNRFASEQDCRNACVQPPDTEQLCRLPKIKGPCRRSTIRWYYDTKTQACTQFTHSCEGNANNFESREQCLNLCGGVA